MESTGGEPDVVGYDQKTGEYIFYDCSAESPKGRRSVCYDGEGQKEREKKGVHPAGNAIDIAAAMGIELLNEDQYRELQKLVDTIVLGRKLAEGFLPYWASVAADPDNPEFESGQKFTDTPKVVFTQTLDQSEWDNTVLAKGDLVDEITKLKQQAGQDIYACGGATFVSALIKHGLIDEFHLFINPTAIGNGMAIFNEPDRKQNLTLIKSTSFDCGIVVLKYEPKRD